MSIRGSARKVIAARADEIPPGSRKIVEVEGRSIGVFNVNGQYFALRNKCPHAGGPLCEGILSGLVLADGVGRYRYARRGEILRCPWHQWEFDLRTGQSWFDPQKTRVRRYSTTVRRGDQIAADAELTQAGMARGPYTAETYTVTADADYVILEL